MRNVFRSIFGSKGRTKATTSPLSPHPRSELMAPRGKTVGYIRSSSKNNSTKDQLLTLIRKGALKKTQIRMDRGTSGKTPVSQRPVWQQMIKEGVKKVIVKSSHRFARGVVTLEEGLAFLKKHGITVETVDSPGLLTIVSRSGMLVRQIEACVREFLKSEIVENFAKGRKAVRLRNQKTKEYTTLSGKGKCEGRRSLLQVFGQPLVSKLRRLLARPYVQRKNKNGQAQSWSSLQQRLLAAGFGSRRMISKSGRVRKAGKPLARSALENLLRDLDRRNF